MSIFSGIGRLFRREASSDSSEKAAHSGPRYGTPLGFILGGGDPSAVATVYRCVSVLSDSVAGLPLQFMRWNGGRFAVDQKSAMQYLLSTEPQPTQSAYTFWSMAVKDMLMQGNAYIFPRTIKGEVTDLVLCRPEYVTYNEWNDTYFIADALNGVYGLFHEPEIIHLFLHSHNGKRGISVLEHARRTIDIATAGDDETAKRFANGGNVKGIITNDKSGVTGYGEYQDEELGNLADDIDRRLTNGRFASLPGQADLKTISLSSADMQFLESRKFTVKEICRFFGVNPAFVFEDTSTNYKSADNANRDFLNNTLDPILKRIENELNRKLVTMSRIDRERIQYDRSGVYSLDLQSRAAYQKTTIESGVYTINDWRRAENQPEVPGGDTVYVSTNLAPLGSAKLYGGKETPKTS